jgi:hypothetical protein
MAPSAQRLHPAGDGPPDLARRIFLNEMDARHRLLDQLWPRADEIDQGIIGENRPWLGLQEQLGYISAGHVGATASLKLTFHLDHSAGADDNSPGCALA